MKCTFNHTNSERLTKEEVTEYILSKGHEIAVHGANYRKEGLIRPTNGINDILLCRKNLGNKYGMIIRGMAYLDSGIRNIFTDNTYRRIRSYLIKDLYIVYSRTLGEDNDLFRLPEDWYAQAPTAYHKNLELMKYIYIYI